jgi:hypothetical protein
MRRAQLSTRRRSPDVRDALSEWLLGLIGCVSERHFGDTRLANQYGVERRA